MTEWQVGVAIYAAIVATGALFLEIRRWFEGPARLSISANPGMKVMNIPGTDDNLYVLVTVVNRGASPTTLTHLALLEYPDYWRRLRRKHSRAVSILIPILPGMEGRLPHVLGPGSVWTGVILDDEKLREWIDTGRLYVAIYASHSDRAKLKLLRPRPDTPKSLEDAEER